MGCFVISQTATGVRFLLRSDAGQTLAISKNYASLDTCKKGIRSLITILPGAPVVNLTAGGGRVCVPLQILQRQGGD